MKYCKSAFTVWLRTSMETFKFRGSFKCTQKYVHSLRAGFLIPTVNKLEGSKKESRSCVKSCHQDIPTLPSMQVSATCYSISSKLTTVSLSTCFFGPVKHCQSV